MSKKRVLQIIIGTALAAMLVGCGADIKKVNDDQESKNTRMVGTNEKTQNLTGAWAEKTYTYETFKEEGMKITNDIKKLSDTFGLHYQDEEKVEQIDGITANVKSIYLDNANPKENKLESMQFSTEFLGASQEGGKYSLKMSLKFDGENAIKEGSFDFGETALAKYAAVLTGEKDRDYKDINKKIMDIIKSDTPDGIIEDSVNGLHEEIAVSKEYIVYTLTTKEFKFEQDGNSGI